MIDIGTENEQSYKIYLNKLFFQNVLILLIFFLDINTSAISSTNSACDVICVQHVIQ